MRFTVIKGSPSAHCCFEYAVLDTIKPNEFGGYEQICECFEKEDADQIALALNQMDSDVDSAEL